MISTLIFICVVVTFVFLGLLVGYDFGAKIKEEKAKDLIKLGYNSGIKDSEEYVKAYMKKGMDLIEAELNKQGLTLKNSKTTTETEKDKKIEAALTKQRQKLENTQATNKTTLKLIKSPSLKIINKEDKK